MCFGPVSCLPFWFLSSLVVYNVVDIVNTLFGGEWKVSRLPPGNDFRYL